ncbi:MAG: SIS domain-containing protein [Acidobacteriota bacterium]
MKLDAFLEHYVDAVPSLLRALDLGLVERAVEWLREARDTGRTIYSAGNGGSSTIASNLVVDLVKSASYGKPRRFRAHHLGDSVSTLTAYANDEGYESIFAEPLRGFASAGDVLVVISGSGDSPNVLAAVRVGKELGCRTIALTSGQQGQLRSMVDLPLLVASRHMGRLEDCFFHLSHLLTYPFIEDVEGVHESAEPTRSVVVVPGVSESS